MVTDPIPHLIFWGVLLLFGFAVLRFHARYIFSQWVSRHRSDSKAED